MGEAGNAARGFTITRVFDAPRELVWKALTEAEQVAQWFGGGVVSWEGLVVDARVGGTWGGTMHVPGEGAKEWTGHFEEVVEPERLVLAFSESEILGGEYEYMTFTLTDVGDGRTELVLRQHGGHLSDDGYEEAQEGTAGFLDVLAGLVETD